MRLFAILLLFAASAFAEPIQVVPAGTLTLSVTGTSAATALPMGDINNKRNAEIQNAGTVTVFVLFCPSSTCTALVASSYPVLPGQSKVVTIPPNTSHVAAITGGTAATAYVTLGIGE